MLQGFQHRRFDVWLCSGWLRCEVDEISPLGFHFLDHVLSLAVRDIVLLVHILTLLVLNVLRLA